MRELTDIQDALLRYSVRLTKNYEDANDLLQETNLKILTYKDRYKTEDIKNIAYKTMRNTFINWVKKDERVGETIMKIDTIEYSTPEQMYIVKEAYYKIGLIDLKLQEPLKMVMAGLSYIEIAKKQSLPIGTVKNRIFRARSLLKQCFDIP